MEFVETPTFTRLVTTLLADEEYRALQQDLLSNPLIYSKSRKDDLSDQETAILREYVKEL